MESKEQYLVFGCISTHEKETFVKGYFSEISFSIVETVCKAAITTQEMKTFVNFGQFWANYTKIYVITSQKYYILHFIEYQYKLKIKGSRQFFIPPEKLWIFKYLQPKYMSWKCLQYFVVGESTARYISITEGN